MFGPPFKFHSNLSFDKSNLKKLRPFHSLMLISYDVNVSPHHLSHFLKYYLSLFGITITILIEDAVMHFEKYSNKSVNFLWHIFENGRVISWVNLKKWTWIHKWHVFFELQWCWREKFCIKIITLLRELEFCQPRQIIF